MLRFPKRITSPKVDKKFKLFLKKTVLAPILMLKLDLDFGSQHENLVLVAYYSEDL